MKRLCIGVIGVGGRAASQARVWRLVVERVFVMFSDELAPLVVFVAVDELIGRAADRFEEGGGDAGKGGSSGGIDAAFRDGTKEASQRVSDSRGGNKVTDDGFADFGGDLIGLLEVAKFALVVETVLGFGGLTKHAAPAAIGKGESTQGRAVF